MCVIVLCDHTFDIFLRFVGVSFVLHCTYLQLDSGSCMCIMVSHTDDLFCVSIVMLLGSQEYLLLEYSFHFVWDEYLQRKQVPHPLISKCFNHLQSSSVGECVVTFEQYRMCHLLTIYSKLYLQG